MNRDDIIKLAKEWAEMNDVGLERFAALVAAAEREECAKVCDAEATIEGIAQRCAAAIRARSNT